MNIPDYLMGRCEICGGELNLHMEQSATEQEGVQWTGHRQCIERFSRDKKFRAQVLERTSKQHVANKLVRDWWQLTGGPAPTSRRQTAIRLWFSFQRFDQTEALNFAEEK